MTAFGWLAVAFALLALGGAPAASARVEALAGVGRVSSEGVGDEPVRRPFAWRWPLVGSAGAIVGAAWLGGGTALGIAAAALWWCAATVARDIRRRRVDASGRAHVLAAVRLLVGELEAGARPSAALAAAADAAGPYKAVLATASRQAAAAGDAAAVLLQHRETRPIGQAWRLGEETGSALAGVLGRVAADLTAAEEQRRTVAVALSGPRASAVLLTSLPLLGIGLGTAMGARPDAFLLGPSLGRTICCAGVLLDVAGVLWMRRILRQAEQL